MIGTSLLEQLVAFHDYKTLSAAAEHLLMTLDLKPECGREYQLALMKDGDAWKMVSIGE